MGVCVVGGAPNGVVHNLLMQFSPYTAQKLKFPKLIFFDIVTTHNDQPSFGNAMHAVRTQCEVLDVGKYSNPSFGPFSQVFGSIPGLAS